MNAFPIETGKKLDLLLEDTMWEKPKRFKDRLIARAVIFDGNSLIFASIDRDDEFATMKYIETSGGGVEKGESLQDAVKREVQEELGLKIELVSYLGQVTDYYNLIGRRNLNHYFLARKVGTVKKHLQDDEERLFHLEPKAVSYQEAIDIYRKNRDQKLGYLLYQREVPVLMEAQRIIASYGLM